MQASLSHVGVVGKCKFLRGLVMQASLSHVRVVG